MAPTKYTPDRNEFIRWIEEGLTHQQMADRVYERTGHRVTREAISVAIGSYGLSKRKMRYKREIPWRVKEQHATLYPIRMLRLLGRRNFDLPIEPPLEKELDSWLSRLDREGLAVGYDPDDDQGFHYIDISFRDHPDPSLPIRIKTLRLVRASQSESMVTGSASPAARHSPSTFAE
jgi:hypothetical protein